MNNVTATLQWDDHSWSERREYLVILLLSKNDGDPLLRGIESDLDRDLDLDLDRDLETDRL